jgi:PTS system galactitol-specific IIA component
MLELNAGLVLWNCPAGSAEAVIEALAERLHAGGLVAADYGRQTYARELKHPTGLPTRPFAIAFPHADAEGVYRSALAVAALARPVTFRNMGDPEADLDVSMVFMLANRDPREQVAALRSLALLFGQPDKLLALQAQSDPLLAADWLRRELGLNEGAAAKDPAREEVSRRTTA